MASTGNIQHRQTLFFYGMADGTICTYTMNTARYHAMIFHCCVALKFSNYFICKKKIEYFALVLNMVF
ncbi:MAG: hypothetical protein B7Y07_07830 [Halothiobacillus sp. 24-54-40]|jgi:hypothetical protein|nr:MAG: hypothetical protein B7Y58_06655 [Halothiobacillus sp. 35-54-62]OYZ86490.1 MAG: hypothetical protein B7Y07_07830 [Halothiobacillus sp. 24-54-40]OZA80187.1 MAG: hypothetical protein B7X64_06940 [Halothiobacillus sp. 39-53-45]